uniref:ATP-binding cassette sub-family A member 1 n=1 Tax=Cacopsylla melanoneura TaxID=428564 RepID=A0A8D8SAH2_9HEMI
MGFFHQLKVVIWKNWITRKRSKARCITDIIWPLFLFLILGWVRTRGLIVKKPNCHYYGKPMPSSGLLPFTQGFLCGFLNTCEQDAQDTELPYEQINPNNFIELVTKLNHLFSNNTEVEQRWSALRNDLQARNGNRTLENSLLRVQQNNQDSTVRGFSMGSFLDKKEVMLKYPNISAQTLDEFFLIQFNLSNFTPAVISSLQTNASSVYCNYDLMDKLIINDNSSYYAARLCNTSDVKAQAIANVWQDLFTSPRFNSTYTQYQDINRTIPSILPALRMYTRFMTNTTTVRTVNQFVTEMSDMSVQFDRLTDVTQNLTRMEQAFFFVLQFFCGNTSARHTLDEYKNSQMFGAKLVDRISDEYAQNSTEDNTPSTDNTLTPFCQDFFKQLDKLFFYYKMMIEIFLRGKILYYPVTPATTRVITRLNSTFQSILETTTSLTTNVSNVATLFDNLRTIRKFLDVESGRQAIRNEIWRAAGNRSQSYNAALNFFDSFFADQNVSDAMNFLNETQNSVEFIVQFLQCVDFNKIIPYNDSATAENDAYLRMNNNTLWALINFTDPGYDTLKPTLTYSIRMSTALTGDTYTSDRFYTMEPRARPLYDLKYITFGFAYLQDLIERSIIIEHTGRSVTPGIILQQFPYPCYIEDQFIKAVSRTFPLFMVLSWVFACSMITKSIVYEKQERLKEMMRVMGLTNGVHWAAWFLDSIVIMIVTAILLSCLLVYGHVIQHSNPVIVFIFLISFCVSTIAQSFLYSVLFDQANIAAASGGIIYFLLYLPYPFLANWLNVLPPIVNYLICLSANVSFGVGAFVIATWEEAGVGVQWSNWNIKLSPSDPFSLYNIICLLYVDSVIYLLLVWYIEAVFPGQYGIPQPWYFPFLRTYWTGAPSPSSPPLSPPLLEPDSTRFEPEPNTLEGAPFTGVRIVNLSKKYANGKLAVNGLSLNFYEDQITSFLGHNGAGKTTTISMLMGMLPASSGTAKIYGLDINTDMNTIRRSLGVCPQYNALFDKLTVEEHMRFYSQLKQVPESQAQVEISNMILDLGIPHKRTSLANTLSGGMQRKLSVAMAFIGGSRTVILDEPTSGVDPYSRRSIWELLIKYKKGRTVILTTHYMDEADLLGDRIAIIAAGKLQCVGSSVFLKNSFARGYYLCLDLRRAHFEQKSLTPPNNNSNQLDEGSVSEVTNLIRSILPTASIHKIAGSEVTYLLPQDPDSMGSYVTLFESLGQDRESLGIDSYGISDTSLEEIFLKIAAEGDPSVVTEDSPPVQNGNVPNSTPSYQESPRKQYAPVATQEPGDTLIRKASGNIYWRQYLALHIKRYQYIKRNKKAIFTELVVPALLVCFMLVMTSFLPKPGEPEPLLLSPWIYSHQFMFLKTNPTGGPWSREYEQEILGPVGLGTLCIKDPPEIQHEQLDLTCPSKQPEWSPAEAYPSLLKTNSSFLSSRNISYGSCSCDSGAQLCSSYPDVPVNLPVASHDTMFNVSDRNLNRWIVNSFRQYAGKLELEPLDIYHRTTGSMIGGIELGVRLALRSNAFSISGNGESRNVPPTDTSNNSSAISPIGNITEKLPNETISNSVKSPVETGSNMTRTSLVDTIPYDPGTAQNSVSNGSSSPPLDVVNDNVKVWFNNKAWISSISFMNAINNVILRASLPANVSREDYGIVAINHPMNLTAKQMALETLKKAGTSILVAVTVLFAMSFVPASFLVFLIEEKVSNSKHLQLVSGVNKLVYWLQVYSWDFMCYMFASTLVVFIFLAFNEEAYISPQNLPGLVALLLCYGCAVIPLMYPCSFIFSVPSTAFVVLGCFNLFVGLITTLTVTVLDALMDDTLESVNEYLKVIFLVFPHFCLGEGLMKLANTYWTSTFANSYGTNLTSVNIWSWRMIGKNLTCMIVHGVLYFSINLSIEYKIYSKLFAGVKPVPPPVTSEEDDVKKEKMRVEGEDGALNDVVVIKRLVKVYANSKGVKPAVNQISFGVGQGECFGLLGLNGAGKTTTFKMLTGAIKPSSGNAFVMNHSILSEMDVVRSYIGYCPQFDALNDRLTPREHLEFYSRVRNIPNVLLNSLVSESLNRFALVHYSDREVRTLSGGNKRKLSTAIALLGNPPLIFLDEPTSGMDPGARRFLWTCIQQAVNDGRCVILTSHNMEECEALCTKLTIMVNGQFTCLGSATHLKSKYGQGYSVKVRCVEGRRSPTEDYLAQHLPMADLVESHATQLHYRITGQVTDLASLFRTLETAKTVAGLVVDYSLSQTSLEDVFLKFANAQVDEIKKPKPLMSYMRSFMFCSCSSCCYSNQTRIETTPATVEV